MGKKVFVNNINITLEGPLIVERAQELHQLLVERLDGVTEKCQQATIDLSRVSDIDACGCQLLALFVESLKRRGATPVLAPAPVGVTERINTLGFRDLLALQPER
ncbi:STAS domain-containing protein [Geomonas sp. Red69]|uniref:STAS domain-containing protein n=1 Tax=Geomonas diazotrophica TaxID=2843197 RepID=UPI001C1266EB|nr:STAS domain-containing protein [Geomonas diazotrophica]MBU5637871.1 STAS domain-containing protein [Geomonas diazotrophica]